MTVMVMMMMIVIMMASMIIMMSKKKMQFMNYATERERESHLVYIYK